MMNKYIFEDSDFWGKEEFDIKGNAYYLLLDLCFKYCESVSFCFRKTKEGLLSWDNRMENYRIPVNQYVLSAYSHYGFSSNYTRVVSDYYEIRHYRLCQETLYFLQQMSDSLFSWVSDSEHHKPDDPVFYRPDGSIFFLSITHEGYCYLMPKDNEDINSILITGNWKGIKT